MLTNLWTLLEDSLFHVMKDSILSGPVLNVRIGNNHFTSRPIEVAMLMVVPCANPNVLEKQRKHCKRNEKTVVRWSLIEPFLGSDCNQYSSYPNEILSLNVASHQCW